MREELSGLTVVATGPLSADKSAGALLRKYVRPRTLGGIDRSRTDLHSVSRRTPTANILTGIARSRPTSTSTYITQLQQ